MKIKAPCGLEAFSLLSSGVQGVNDFARVFTCTCESGCSGQLGCVNFLQVSFQAKMHHKLWLSTAQALNPSSALVKMPASPSLILGPSETATGYLSLAVSHLCATCAGLCLQNMKVRNNLSCYRGSQKMLERRSELFQFFLCNLFSFRKEKNMQ